MKKKLLKSVISFGLAVAVVFGSLGTGIYATGTVEASDLSTAKITTTKTLAQVTGVKYDSAKDRIYWNKVSGADYYYVTIKSSTGTTENIYIYDDLYYDVSSYHQATASTYTITVCAKSDAYYVVASNVSRSNLSNYDYNTYEYDSTSDTYTLYKHPVGTESAALSVTLSAAKTSSTTAVSSAPTIVKKEVYDNYVYFAVKGDVMNYSYTGEYLFWEYSNNASFQSSSDGTNWVYTSITSSDTPTKSVCLNNYEAGTVIYVRARVYNPNAQKYSSYSNVVSYTVPKSKVSSISTYVTGTTVTLSASSDGPVTGYQFAKKVGGKWVVLAKQTDNTYKDSGLTKNTRYTYRVRSYVYNSSTKKTTYSKWKKVEAITWAANLNLKAGAASATSVKLTWNKVSGAEGYEIYRSDTTGSSLTYKKGELTSSYTDYVLVKKLGSKKTSYTEKKLTNGNTYTYQIRAYKTINNQKVYISSSQSVVLDASSMSVNQQYVNASGKTVVKWDKLTGIKGYYLEKKNETTGVYDRVKTLKATKTSYTFPKVSAGSNSVTYRIRPYDADRIYTGVKVTVEPSLATVTGVKATKTANGIKVSWNAVSGADYYEVYRTTSSKATYDSTAKTYTSISSYSEVYDCNLTTKSDGTINWTASSQTYQIEGTSVVDQTLTYTDSEGNVKIYNKNEGPEAGVTYYYYVVAYAKAANGSLNYDTIQSPGYSKAASATYTAKKATKPKKVTVSSKTKGTATIKIKKVKGATGYAIYRANKKKGTYVLVGLTTKTTFTDKSVTAGKTYYYKVASYVLSEEKANIYSAKTKAYKLTIKK